MNLLLDTHVWLWSVMERQRLSREVARELEKSAQHVWLSPISLWEVQTLVERKKLHFKEGVRAWLSQAVDLTAPREAALTIEVARDLADFELPHRDPADKFLVATARVYDLTLVTADERIINSKACRVLANR